VSKAIGLIGGLGPGAGVHYYTALLAAHAAHGATLDLVMVQADMPRVLACVAAGDLAGLADYLAELIGRLKAAGAEIAVIPAVTPHICEALLLQRSTLPLISMITVARGALAARGLKRIALLGARFTVESDMFGRLSDYDVVRPLAEEIAFIHGAYTDIVASGAGVPAQVNALRQITQRLIADEGIEAIVVAGTDFALLPDGAWTGIPIVDCAALHIEEIMRQTLAV